MWKSPDVKFPNGGYGKDQETEGKKGFDRSQSRVSRLPVSMLFSLNYAFIIFPLNHVSKYFL